jgi:DNA-binding PadR family transcriptional regulator
MREWTEIGFSSIYYLLGKLRDRGLIAEVDEDTGAAGRRQGKARKTFAPTADGKRACARAAETAVAELRPVFPPLLVGLANQPVIPPRKLRAALTRRAAALADKIAEVRGAAAAAAGAPDFVRAIFDYSLGQLEAEQRWLAAYLNARPDKEGTPT